jgi:hypothetical protein
MSAPKPASVEQDREKPVREQLQRMLGSATFQQVDRLKRFLTFTVTVRWSLPQ